MVVYKDLVAPIFQGVEVVSFENQFTKWSFT